MNWDQILVTVVSSIITQVLGIISLVLILTKKRINEADEERRRRKALECLVKKQIAVLEMIADGTVKTEPDIKQMCTIFVTKYNSTPKKERWELYASFELYIDMIANGEVKTTPNIKDQAQQVRELYLQSNPIIKEVK